MDSQITINQEGYRAEILWHNMHMGAAGTGGVCRYMHYLYTTKPDWSWVWFCVHKADKKVPKMWCIKGAYIMHMCVHSM